MQNALLNYKYVQYKFLKIYFQISYAVASKRNALWYAEHLRQTIKECILNVSRHIIIFMHVTNYI